MNTTLLRKGQIILVLGILLTLGSTVHFFFLAEDWDGMVSLLLAVFIAIPLTCIGIFLILRARSHNIGTSSGTTPSSVPSKIAATTLLIISIFSLNGMQRSLMGYRSDVQWWSWHMTNPDDIIRYTTTQPFLGYKIAITFLTILCLFSLFSSVLIFMKRRAGIISLRVISGLLLIISLGFPFLLVGPFRTTADLLIASFWSFPLWLALLLFTYSKSAKTI